VPDGTRDLVPEKALPMESGLDELGAIDWQKGCYMGQELTARIAVHHAMIAYIL